VRAQVVATQKDARETARGKTHFAKFGCTTRDKHGRCANTRIVAMRGGGHRASHEAWWSRGREIGFLWWRAKKYSKHDVSTVSAIYLSLLLRFITLSAAVGFQLARTAIHIIIAA
jgi:hypothetical protein